MEKATSLSHDVDDAFKGRLLRASAPTEGSRYLCLLSRGFMAALIAVLVVGLAPSARAQSAALPTCYKSGTELWCVTSAVPRYNQNNPALGTDWFPAGATDSVLCTPTTGAMTLAASLATRGTALIKDPFINSFIPLWRDKTAQGQARQIQVVAKAMGTNPSLGTLDQFDFGFAQSDFTKFFKSLAPNFKATGGTTNYYSSLEDPLVGLGTQNGTPLKATTVASLFRKGYLLSLGIGYYIDMYSDDSSRYLLRAGGHQVVLTGVIYPQTGPMRFLLADPLRPQSMRQVPVNALPAKSTVNGFMYWRVGDSTGKLSLSPTVMKQYDFIHYVDSYPIDLADETGAQVSHQVYEGLDMAVGFSVQLPSATPTPQAQIH